VDVYLWHGIPGLTFHQVGLTLKSYYQN